MANGIVLKDSLCSVKIETTENTYAGPASGADLFQPTEKGISISGDITFEERDLLTAGLSKPQSIPGSYALKGKMAVEMRGSGVEGQAPQWGVLLQALFGAVHNNTNNVTSKNSDGTHTVIPIGDSDIADFNVGDIICLKVPNNYWMCTVQSLVTTSGSATITILPAYNVAGTPTNVPAETVISQTVTYQPADSGAPSFSATMYYANVIVFKGTGARTASMTLGGYSTGKIPSLEFDFEGIGFSKAAGSSDYTPTFDTALPPVVLKAHVFQGGTEVFCDSVTLKFDNDLGWMTSTAFVGGRFKGRVAGTRKITGTFNPYMDDTSVANWTTFLAGSNFSMFITATVADPANVGQFVMGSNWGIYLPNVMLTKEDVGDMKGVLTDALAFEANGGPQGILQEIFLGLC